jgi:hypothetical protein
VARFRRFALIGVAVVLVMELTVYLAISNIVDSTE